MEAFIAWIEKNIMPGANKLASERHLKAIRDTFMTILPPIFFGGIIAVINSAPVTDDTTNGILLAWAAFDQQNALVLGWLNQVPLGSSLFMFVLVLPITSPNRMKWRCFFQSLFLLRDTACL